MDNLKEISKIEFYHNNGIWGFRKWTLIAYDDNNKQIYYDDKNDSNNYLKYVRFIQELKKLGYKLSYSHRIQLKGGEKGFLNKALISRVNKQHLYEIALCAGYSKNDLDNLKNKNDDYKQEFSFNVGLELDELKEVFNYI